MQRWSMAVRLSGSDLDVNESVLGCNLGGAACFGRRGRHDLGWPWLGWAARAWRRTVCGVEVGAWAGAEMRLVRV